MSNDVMLQLERDFLLNKSLQIQNRVWEYNHNVSAAKRLSEQYFPSWNGNSVPGLGLIFSSGNGQRALSGSRSPLVPSGDNQSRGAQSGMAQYRGLSPGSNLLVVSQAPRESNGHFSPGAQSKQTSQYSIDREWPSLNHDRGSSFQGWIPRNSSQPVNSNPSAKQGTQNDASSGKQGTGQVDAGGPFKDVNPPSGNEGNTEPDEESTQFEPMEKRNPTWAEVTEQNIKGLDPFARFADITLVDSFEAEEVEDILDGIISNTALVVNFAEVKEADIMDIDPR
ncbi:hypothetical protein R1sor_018621 [Riccia sorocarpa]|uniref:Uncharacterized protein n=1 Tax=Riccia sorocarpa TaxID=122646 RepID=A0ABD3IBX1_9MARC